MQKFRFMFAFLACLLTFSFAAEVVYDVEGLATSNGRVVGAISTAVAWDTLVASDSATVISNFAPQRGYSYALVVGTITGTGSDSVKLQIVVDCKDGSGNVIYRAAVDSVTAAAGGAFDLDIGSIAEAAGAVGSKYDIKLLTYTGAGTQAIINRLYVYRYRPVGIEQNWQAGR